MADFFGGLTGLTGTTTYPIDAYEQNQANVYQPGSPTEPWYERVLEYGIGRWIDSEYGPPAPPQLQTSVSTSGKPVGVTAPSGLATIPPVVWLAIGAVVLVVLLSR